MSHPAVLAFQSNALPAILPLSKLSLRAAGNGRFIASTFERDIAKVVSAARADLAAVPR